MSLAGSTTPLVLDGSLRAELDSRKSRGKTFSVSETLSLVVPLCTQLAEAHASGVRLFVHPGSLDYTPSSLTIAHDRARLRPTHPSDELCLPPEERAGTPGDARGSVFSLGALLYEMLTGEVVGPGMRRPRDLVANLPPLLETVLGKALVGDPKHRPGDLAALAQALHNAMPSASIAPPPGDTSHLDHDGDFEVDVRLSLMPPSSGDPPAIPRPAATPQFHDPFQAVARKPAPAVRSAPKADDLTSRLAELKMRLEADRRARFMVTKDGMDHGPFSAVELLQQVASRQFEGEHRLRDTLSDQERPIAEWPEFAPFAEQAKLHQVIAQERVQLEAVVAAEQQGAQRKTFVGLVLVGVLLAAIAGLWVRSRNRVSTERTGTELASGNDAVVIEAFGELSGRAKAPGAPGRPGGAGGPAGPPPAGGYPQLSGGLSCEGAMDKYVTELKMSGNAPDIGAASFGNVLNHGGYIAACGVPDSTEVNICVAVQNGRAVGVSVSTRPNNGSINGCVASAVRGMSFPSGPRLDVARTTFAAKE